MCVTTDQHAGGDRQYFVLVWKRKVMSHPTLPLFGLMFLC